MFALLIVEVDKRSAMKGEVDDGCGTEYLWWQGLDQLPARKGVVEQRLRLRFGASWGRSSVGCIEEGRSCLRTLEVVFPGERRRRQI